MFDSVIGHKVPKEMLLNDIQKNKISHAYAFVGPMGIGKKKLSDEFAKELLKVDNLNAAVDYKYIKKIDGKKNILIEQIRKELVDDVYIAPAVGSYKVYVIDNAEDLNVESQNALLKTLEEPPSYVCIILITENIQTFLPTVISRVKQVKFDKLSNEEITNYCIQNNYEDVFTDNMLKYIDGSLGKLVNLKEETEFNLFKEAEKIVNCIKLKKELEIIKLLDKISFKNTNVLDYLQYLLYFNGLYKAMFEVENARRKLKYNGNEDIVKTMFVINSCK